MSIFIAFEGGDGAGKSTQVRLLAEALEARGREVVTTREPGGTPLGLQVRSLLLHGVDGSVSPRAEVMLFGADRAQHVDALIRPALERGAVVITDRFVDSTFAYQGAGRGFDVVTLEPLMQWVTGGLVPDLTVVLDISPLEGRLRREGVHDRMEREEEPFHARLRQGFLDLAARDSHRYLVLDAALPIETLQAEIAQRVTGLLAQD